MRTFTKGFLAAVCGIILFLLLLVGWLELIGQGTGFFFRGQEEEETAVAETSDEGATTDETPEEIVLEPMPTYSAWDDYEPYVPPTDAENIEIVNAGYEAFRDMVEKEMQDEKGKNNVTVERYENRIVVAYWEDDLIDRLSKGQIDDTTMTLWRKMKTETKDISGDYYLKLFDEDLPNGHVTVNLLNERDKDEIILSYEDGSLVHDGLTEEQYEEQRNRSIKDDQANDEQANGGN